MNDLISRQAVIENIRKYADKKFCNGEIELANGILKSLSIIKKQPTAYDVDEVVEQLKKASYETHEWSDGTSSFNLRMIEEANAIEIVKGAVKDD